ncbi:MAG: TSCPD domain-containing protein, partial [Lachnospiraceae bacterium]|nr:TSCPD domain-containing protein [Lachnospiraceae bacterium]
MRYQIKGTCSSAIDIELKDGLIDSVAFQGG